AERVKREISKRLPGTATLVDTKVIDPSEALAERQREGASGILDDEPSRETSPELRAIEDDFLRRHWEQWLDTRVPALGNRTPRQAARSAGGRERLEALLAALARDPAGARNAASHVAFIRENLGLPKQPRPHLVSLAESIDATTPAGKLQLHILGAIAEFERAWIAERVKAGCRGCFRDGSALRSYAVRTGQGLCVGSNLLGSFSNQVFEPSSRPVITFLVVALSFVAVGLGFERWNRGPAEPYIIAAEDAWSGRIGPALYDDDQMAARTGAMTNGRARDIFSPSPPSLVVVLLPLAWLPTRGRSSV